jgi:hypothetical protein
MSTNCGSSAVFSRIAYDAGVTGQFSNFSSASPAYPLADGGCTLGLKQPHVNNSGMNGTTAQASEQTRPGLKIVDGDINLLATPDILTKFLPHATARAIASNVTYPSPNVPPYFHILLHRDSSLYTYTDLVINRFSLGSSAGQPVKMVMGCMGRDRESSLQADSAWPVGLLPTNKAPYMHQDAVITINGTTYKFRQWQLDVDNKLSPEYFDAVTPCGFLRGDQAMTTLKLVGPHTQTTVASIMQGATPPSALDVVITLTHPTAGMSLIIRCQALQIPINDPPVSKGTIMLDLTGVARTKDGGASGGAEVIFTNDDTPS